MFSKLFAESGLSLDRLKALLAVGAAGSIVKAATGDPVRQSQYSRQIKELEDFFRVKLVERHGKGIRLTAPGKELARISRFFLLGLSNFQRGCLAEEQTFRVGAGATFIQRFLLPVVAKASAGRSNTRFIIEVAEDDEIERRLHDLTLDFGLMNRATISRPLQLQELGKWRLRLWVPAGLHPDRKTAARALKERRLALALAQKELHACGLEVLNDQAPRLVCDDFLQAMGALEQQQLAAVLPDFLAPCVAEKAIFPVPVAAIDSQVLHFRLAWNPRLLRLNPHAIRSRDFLGTSLERQMRGRSSVARP